MRIFTSEMILIKQGAEYLRVVSLAYLLTGISQIYLCILRNTDCASKSMVISSASVLINIVLNAIFIFGLFGITPLGIKGAALATVVAKIIECVCCFIVSIRKNRVNLRLRYIKKSDCNLKSLFWKYTTPVLGNEAVWGIGFTMYSVIIGRLGSDAISANSIANIVKNIIACFCIGLGSGGGIIVGNELGKGNLDLAKKYGAKLCRLSLITVNCHLLYIIIKRIIKRAWLHISGSICAL